MAEYIKLKCPYGDDFEGGDECDRCEQYELCMETPDANVVERDEYEKLKKENVELKIKCDDAEKRCCHAMDRNAKLRSKIDKAIEDIEDLDPITERVGLQVKQEILNILKGI